jgi:hypothetical protein
MVSHTCNPSTCKAEIGGLKVGSQPGLHSELEASLGYPVSKKKERKERKKKNSYNPIFLRKV